MPDFGRRVPETNLNVTWDNEAVAGGRRKHQSFDLSRWDTVTPIGIANKIVELCQGNYSRLEEHYLTDTSFWGEVAMALLNSNTDRDRLWLYVCWSNNRHGVKDMVSNVIYGEHDATLPSPKESTPFPDHTVVTYCWCNKHYTLGDQDLAFIQCDKCDIWYHGICVDVNVVDYPANEDYICPRCADYSRFDVPTVLDISTATEGVVFSGRLDRTNTRRRLFKAHSVSPISPDPSLITATRRHTIGKVLEEEERLQGHNVEFQDDIDHTNIPNVKTSISEDERQEASQEISGSEGEPGELIGLLPGEETANTFILEVPANEWAKYVPDDRSDKAILKPGYTDMLYKHFFHMRKSCVIAFKGQKLHFEQDQPLIKPTKRKAAYFWCRAICTQPKCEARYLFSVDNEPKGNLVFVYVRCAGVVKHDPNDIKSRHLKGDLREKAKDALKIDKPSVHRRKLFGSCHLGAVEAGNYSQVKNLQVFRKISSEAMKQHDLDENLFVDLTAATYNFKTSIIGKKLNGYVQLLSIEPLQIIMFTERQILLLRDSLSALPHLVLHCDSTGKVVSKLPPPYSQTVCYYYALVIQLPGSAPLAVGEYVTNSHNVPSIHNFLEVFLHSFKTVTGIHSISKKILRVEMDFSHALISSFVKAFDAGPLRFYLLECWESSKKLIKQNTTVIHICERHTAEFLKRQFSLTYSKEPDKNAMCKTLMDWIYGFVRGTDLWSFCRRARDIITIVGSRMQDNSVQESLRNLRSSTVREVKANLTATDNKSSTRLFVIITLGNEPWAGLDTTDLQRETTLSRQSPYGLYAYKLCDELGIVTNVKELEVAEDKDEAFLQSLLEDDEFEYKTRPAKSKWPRNPYYNDKLLRYMLVVVLPFGGILNRSLLLLNEYGTSVVTNNPAENWFYILKRTEYSGNFPMTVSRFIRGQVQVIMDRCNVMRIDALNKLVRRHKKSQHKKKEQVLPDTTPTPKHFRTPESTGSLKEKHPSMAAEYWAKKPDRGWVPYQPPSTFVSVNLIPWGGTVTDESGKSYELINTCTLDNQLQILYTLHKASKYCQSFISLLLNSSLDTSDLVKSSIKKIFKLLDQKKFGEAKKEWITKVLGWAINGTRPDYGRIGRVIRNTNLYSTEEAMSFDYLTFLMPINEVNVCESDGCVETATKTVFSTDFVFHCIEEFPRKINNGGTVRKCGACGSRRSYTYEMPFDHENAFFAFAVTGIPGSPLMEDNLVEDCIIKGIPYKLFAYTINRGNCHFITVFLDGNQKYIYDGLEVKNGRTVLKRHSKIGFPVNIVWFKRSFDPDEEVAEEGGQHSKETNDDSGTSPENESNHDEQEGNDEPPNNLSSTYQFDNTERESYFGNIKKQQAGDRNGQDFEVAETETNNASELREEVGGNYMEEMEKLSGVVGGIGNFEIGETDILFKVGWLDGFICHLRSLKPDAALHDVIVLAYAEYLIAASGVQDLVLVDHLTITAEASRKFAVKRAAIKILPITCSWAVLHKTELSEWMLMLVEVSTQEIKFYNSTEIDNNYYDSLEQCLCGILMEIFPLVKWKISRRKLSNETVEPKDGSLHVLAKLNDIICRLNNVQKLKIGKNAFRQKILRDLLETTEKGRSILLSYEEQLENLITEQTSGTGCSIEGDKAFKIREKFISLHDDLSHGYLRRLSIKAKQLSDLELKKLFDECTGKIMQLFNEFNKSESVKQHLLALNQAYNISPIRLQMFSNKQILKLADFASNLLENYSATQEEVENVKLNFGTFLAYAMSYRLRIIVYSKFSGLSEEDLVEENKIYVRKEANLGELFVEGNAMLNG